MKKKKFNFTYERIKRPKSEGTRWMIPKVKVTGKFFHPALTKLVGLENEENANSINKQNL